MSALAVVAWLHVMVVIRKSLSDIAFISGLAAGAAERDRSMGTKP